jgi:hypothetical protein
MVIVLATEYSTAKKQRSTVEERRSTVKGGATASNETKV